MDQYSKIELQALIKTYNKKNENKIINVDKLKKKELYEICIQYSLIHSSQSPDNVINYKNITKEHLLQNIEIHFLKQQKPVPVTFAKMTKKDLIDFIELNNIPHFTPDKLKKEIEYYEKSSFYKKVIIYNMLRYDNVDPSQIENNEDYVKKKKLDTDIQHMNEYASLLKTLYDAYGNFCKNTGTEYEGSKIKSFPKIIALLKTISK